MENYNSKRASSSNRCQYRYIHHEPPTFSSTQLPSLTPQILSLVHLTPRVSLPPKRTKASYPWKRNHLHSTAGNIEVCHHQWSKSQNKLYTQDQRQPYIPSTPVWRSFRCRRSLSVRQRSSKCMQQCNNSQSGTKEALLIGLPAAAAAGDHAHRLTDVVWNCSMLQKKPAWNRNLARMAGKGEVRGWWNRMVVKAREGKESPGHPPQYHPGITRISSGYNKSIIRV
jgi:hypothetical protein